MNLKKIEREIEKLFPRLLMIDDAEPKFVDGYNTMVKTAKVRDIEIKQNIISLIKQVVESVPVGQNIPPQNKVFFGLYYTFCHVYKKKDKRGNDKYFKEVLHINKGLSLKEAIKMAIEYGEEFRWFGITGEAIDVQEIKDWKERILKQLKEEK